MKKIVCTRGVPASWKTTWALNEVKEKWAVRLNKDEIRERNPWFKEEQVIDLERHSAEQYIADYQQSYIIIDNTHLKYKDWTENKHIQFYKKLAEDYWYYFEIKEFYISEEVAILRDKIRWLEGGRSVGKKVIKNFFRNMTTPTKYPANPIFSSYKEGLPEAVIVDIDWTLAFMDWKRSPYDYEKVGGDRFNVYLDRLLDPLRESHKIIIVSWRKDDCFEETVKWLEDNRFDYDEIYMRKTGDDRNDAIVKEEIFDKNIKDEYNILAVFDDRNRVVDKWRELWLPTYQVWYWDF